VNAKKENGDPEPTTGATICGVLPLLTPPWGVRGAPGHRLLEFLGRGTTDKKKKGSVNQAILITGGGGGGGPRKKTELKKKIG